MPYITFQHEKDVNFTLLYQWSRAYSVNVAFRKRNRYKLVAQIGTTTARVLERKSTYGYFFLKAYFFCKTKPYLVIIYFLSEELVLN